MSCSCHPFGITPPPFSLPVLCSPCFCRHRPSEVLHRLRLGHFKGWQSGEVPLPVGFLPSSSSDAGSVGLPTQLGWTEVGEHQQEPLLWTRAMRPCWHHRSHISIMLERQISPGSWPSSWRKWQMVSLAPLFSSPTAVAAPSGTQQRDGKAVWASSSLGLFSPPPPGFPMGAGRDVNKRKRHYSMAARKEGNEETGNKLRKGKTVISKSVTETSYYINGCGSCHTSVAGCFSVKFSCNAIFSIRSL